GAPVFDIQLHAQAVSVIPPGRSFDGGSQQRVSGEIEIAALVQIVLASVGKLDIPLKRSGALGAPGVGGPGTSHQVAAAPSFGAGLEVGVGSIAASSASSASAAVTVAEVHFPEPGKGGALLARAGDQMGSILPGFTFDVTPDGDSLHCRVLPENRKLFLVPGQLRLIVSGH